MYVCCFLFPCHFADVLLRIRLDSFDGFVDEYEVHFSARIGSPKFILETSVGIHHGIVLSGGAGYHRDRGALILLEQEQDRIFEVWKQRQTF